MKRFRAIRHELFDNDMETFRAPKLYVGMIVEEMAGNLGIVTVLSDMEYMFIAQEYTERLRQLGADVEEYDEF